MSTTAWNQEQEVLIASAELGDSTGRDAVALLVAARKRAFDAEQHIHQVSTQPEPDCGSSSCIFSSKGGMRTNGPCRCYENAGFHGSAVMAAKQMLREVLLLRAKVDAAPMLRHIISASSKPGAVVLDAFGGSGSTANAARQLGRRAISIELCERWCRRQVALVSQGILPI